jgi:hypothetical protein
MLKSVDIGNKLFNFQFWQIKSNKHLLWLKLMGKWILTLKAWVNVQLNKETLLPNIMKVKASGIKQQNSMNLQKIQ